TYHHPLRPPPFRPRLIHQYVFKKSSTISSMPLNRPPPALLSTRPAPVPFISSMDTSTTFTLTAAGLLAPKIKCISDNKKDCYTFQSKSDAFTRNIAVKDYQGNQVCKVKNKGEHLLDLYLTTESKDINVQFRDMIAFKKAAEKSQSGGFNSRMSPGFHSGQEEEDEMAGRFVPEASTSTQSARWAFEFEGRTYQWMTGGGHGLNAPPGSDVLICHTASAGPMSKIAQLQSGHTGTSDKLAIYNGPIANVLDKNGLQILLLTSVLSLMEIMNDRSRELADFD
ncbi:hypothetical protein BGW38_007155, partial [Lunasporangiospora selenospora]